MRRFTFSILMPLLLVWSLLSCDRTPSGVLSVNEMGDLIVDMQLAEAYIESHMQDFTDDSSKLVVKQSIFKKYGITQQDYDSSLVWYAHNMDSYIKAHDRAVGKLQSMQQKAIKSKDESNIGQDMELTMEGTNGAMPPRSRQIKNPSLKKMGASTKGDSADLWDAPRCYLLAQGAKRGFITFDVRPDVNRQPGDRYQLSYKLARGGNEFKVSLNIDYTDGATAQITRGTYSDGWVAIDIQSDTARQVRRVYGYVSYDIKPGQTAYVDSLMLLRTHLSKSNYGYINAQRLIERPKK
jgi:hypothetical protein